MKVCKLNINKSHITNIKPYNLTQVNTEPSINNEEIINLTESDYDSDNY